MTTKKPQKKSNTLSKPQVKFEYLWFEWVEVDIDDLFVNAKSVKQQLNLLKNQVIRFFSLWKPEVAKAFDEVYWELNSAYQQWLVDKWLNEK